MRNQKNVQNHPRTCLIAGASGLVGRHLLDLILQRSEFSSVLSLGRKVLPLEHEKLTQKVASFGPYLAVDPAEIAFCCLGTTLKKAGSREAFFQVDHDAVVHFARACRTAGVEHFLCVSALGADANSPVFYNRVKGQTELDLQKIGFRSLTILQPSLLLGDRSEHRFLEKLAQKFSPLLNGLLVGPLRKWRAVPASQVALAMMQSALASREGVEIIGNLQILAVFD